MRRRLRSRGKTVPADEEEYEAARPATVPSSDDEEANEDLSLAIVEKARKREAKRQRAEDGGGAVPASAPCASSASSSPEETALLFYDRPPSSSVGGLVAPVDEARKKPKKPKKKKLQQQEQLPPVEEVTVAAVGDEKKPLAAIGDEEKSLAAIGVEEKPLAAIGNEEKPLAAIGDEEKSPIKVDLVVTEVNEGSNSLVFRKLLRGPRYFDPAENQWGTCFNCGEEGHIAANCTMEKRQKPCFVCGLFGHTSKKCLQGQDCFSCKRRGHLAKDCPEKNKNITSDSEICLRCGGTGHVMSSCRNDYSPDDLKEVQCYLCKQYGHLCCVEFVDSGPREVFCYNCAQPGHTGLGCAKPRGDNTADASPPLCYICHEEGHFARGCTKRKQSARMRQLSTPRTFGKENKKARASKSVPRDFGGEPRKKKKVFEERWNMTPVKSKGGWIVDDPGDLPRKKLRAKNYTSPSTPVKRSQRNCSSDFRGYSSSSHSRKKWKSYTGTPGSRARARTNHGDFST